MIHDADDVARDTTTMPKKVVRDRLAWAFVLAFCGVAAIYLLLPLRDLYRTWNDFRWVYVSGKTWLEGASPYDFPAWADAWKRTPHSFFADDPTQPFLYPPHWAVIAIPLATLPYGLAIRIWDVLDVAAFAATLMLVVRMVSPHLPRGRERIALVALIGMTALHGSLRWSLWESQLAVIPMLGVVGAFAAWKEGSVAKLALFSFLAALKPQIGALPLVFLLLNGGHRGVLLAGGVAGAISLASLAPFDLTAFPAQFADCYARHMHAGFNQKDTFSNLSALFASIDGGERFFWIAPALALVWLLGITVWRRMRRGVDPLVDDPLMMLLLVGTTVPALLPLHGYDLVVVTPLILAAVLVRPRVLAIGFVVLVELSGRVDFLERRLGLHPILPVLTLALMFVGLAATYFRPRAETPIVAVRP